MRLTVLAAAIPAAILALLSPRPADALLLHVNFTVTGAANDPLDAGRHAYGYVVFEVPQWIVDNPGTIGLGYSDGLRAKDLCFSWDGVRYTTENADLAYVRFAPLFGQTPSGEFGRIGVTADEFAVCAFLNGLSGVTAGVGPDIAVGDMFFTYTRPSADRYVGYTSFFVTVPTGGVLPLFGLALATMAFAVRRRAD